MTSLIRGSMYGDPRVQASRELPHGMTPDSIEQLASRFENFVPGISSSQGTASKQFFEGLLPEGAELSPRTHRQAQFNIPGGGALSNFIGGGVGGGGGTMVTPQQPYQPEFSDPSRQAYPIHRILANRYWRLFYKLDPTIGNCVDLMATMPWSDCQLTGEGVTGEIKEAYEEMWKECEILKILEYMVKEFLVVGEVCNHCFFDDSKGIWTYVALHNPDQLEVIDAPFIKMQPVIEFIPDDRLRAVLTSNNHLLRRIREQMPAELIARLIARQNIPLSPINATFIPRRLHPYDTRGTSIISRMWRILMYEDSQPPGTPITRPDGTNTPIEQISINDLIVGKNGDIQKITHISEKYSEELMEIKIHGGWTINCTKSHKWPIFKKDSYRSGSIKTLASNIQIGDYLSIPRQFVKSKLDKNSTSSMARLLGYYVAEGSRTNISSQYKGKTYKYHHGLSWALSLDEKNTLAKDILEICTKINCSPKFYVGKSNLSRNGCAIHTHKKADIWLADWMFSNGGEHAATKQLSQMVMGWPLKLKQEFIRGYFRGDGSYNLLCKPKTKITQRRTVQSTVKAATVSSALAYQIQLILAQLGIFAKIRVYQPPNNDGRNRRKINYIECTGRHGDKLASVVWGKVRERSVMDHRSQSRVVVTKTHILLPITKVAIEKYDGLVYSLETSGDHSYLNANVATYNSIYNASIQTARRQSSPLKIAKLGNPQTGWIPSPEHEQRLLRLLAQAEMDPAAWITYHYGIQFELVGVQERVMNISQHNEVIERIKLVALGISKAFLSGEVTYSSAYTGLSVFLQRMKAMRNFFVNSWVIPKFFTPIAKMNGWVKSDKGELNHRYRIKRSQREIEQQNRYIIPHIEWEKQLDQTINSDLVNAMTSLEGLGIKFSKTTKYAAVNKKFEEEVRKIKEEQKFEMELAPYIAPSQVAGGPGAPGGAPPMPTGGGPPAPMGGEPEPGAGALPPGAMGPGAEASSDKAGAGGGTGPSGKKDPAVRDMESSIWDRKGRSGNWSASEIHELDQLIREGHTDSPLWGDMDGPAFRKAVNSQDAWQVLEVIEDHLTDHGYPADDIRQLRRILDEEGVLKDISTGDVEVLKSVERKMDDSGTLNDQDAMERLSAQIDGEKTGTVEMGNPELLYVGHGNQDIGSWSGDISDKIPR